MINDTLDTSGHDLTETMAKDRRRRVELAASQKLGDLDAMLLPLWMAVTRLTARLDAGGSA